MVKVTMPWPKWLAATAGASPSTSSTVVSASCGPPHQRTRSRWREVTHQPAWLAMRSGGQRLAKPSAVLDIHSRPIGAGAISSDGNWLTR